MAAGGESFASLPLGLHDRRGGRRGAGLFAFPQHDGALAAMRGLGTLACVPGELPEVGLLLISNSDSSTAFSSNRAHSPKRNLCGPEGLRESLY